jgi:hypothetical protein
MFQGIPYCGEIVAGGFHLLSNLQGKIIIVEKNTDIEESLCETNERHRISLTLH